LHNTSSYHDLPFFRFSPDTGLQKFHEIKRNQNHNLLASDYFQLLPIPGEGRLAYTVQKSNVSHKLLIGSDSYFTITLQMGISRKVNSFLSEPLLFTLIQEDPLCVRVNSAGDKPIKFNLLRMKENTTVEIQATGCFIRKGIYNFFSLKINKGMTVHVSNSNIYLPFFGVVSGDKILPPTSTSLRFMDSNCFITLLNEQTKKRKRRRIAKVLNNKPALRVLKRNMEMGGKARKLPRPRKKFKLFTKRSSLPVKINSFEDESDPFANADDNNKMFNVEISSDFENADSSHSLTKDSDMIHSFNQNITDILLADDFIPSNCSKCKTAVTNPVIQLDSFHDLEFLCDSCKDVIDICSSPSKKNAALRVRNCALSLWEMSSSPKALIKQFEAITVALKKKTPSKLKSTDFATIVGDIILPCNLADIEV
jgi:hypothetical protein